MKMVNSAIYGQFSEVVPVLEQGWYRYHLTVAKWYRYQGKVVPVPLTKTKVVPVRRQSGTGTNFQNMIGTGTDPSGTGTTASGNPDFLYLCIVKLEFAY